MTTTRSKSVGRAAAAARKTKHDQKTPLPPKGSKPEVTHTESVQTAAADAGLATSAWGQSIRRITSGEATLEQVAKDTGNSVDFVKGKFFDIAGRKYTQRTAVDQPTPATDGQAGEVKARRDQGQTWREISEALALGAGKTGTSRARRLYRQANEGAAAPKKEPVARKRRALVDPYADDISGDQPATSRSRAASMPMVRLDRMRLHCVDKRTKAQRGNRPTMADVHTAEVGRQQAISLARVFEGDGYTVTTEQQQADGTWGKVSV